MSKFIKYSLFLADSNNVQAPNQAQIGSITYNGTDAEVDAFWAVVEADGVNGEGQVISSAYLYEAGVTSDSYIISPNYNLAVLVAGVVGGTASPVTGLVSGNSEAGALAYSSNPVLNPFYPTGIPLNGNAVDTVRYSGISTNFLTAKTAGSPQLGVYDSLLDQVVLQVKDSSDDSSYAVFKTEDGETAAILSGASGYKMTAIANNGTRIVVGYANNTEGGDVDHIIGYSDDNLATITFVLIKRNENFSGFVSIASNGGNTWIAVPTGSGGEIFRSTDNGVTWAEITVTGCIGINKVIWDGTQFVLVGQATGDVTYLGTSVAGATWVQVDTTAHDGTSASLNDITKVGTTYIITGTNLLVSAVEKDGVCLKGTVLGTLTASMIQDGGNPMLSSYGLAATTGIAVAQNSNGTPYFSTDNGATWTASATPPSSGVNVSYHIGSSRFVTAGSGVLSYSPDGDVWTDTTVDDLEFYATEPSANLWMSGQ